MNRRDFLRTSAPLALAPAILTHRGLSQTAETAPPPLPAPGADGWVSLINGRDFAGWYSMLQTSGKGIAEEKGMIMMARSPLRSNTRRPGSAGSK